MLVVVVVVVVVVVMVVVVVEIENKGIHREKTRNNDEVISFNEEVTWKYMNYTIQKPGGG